MNQAGATTFVDPELVHGMLRLGISMGRSIETPLERSTSSQRGQQEATLGSKRAPCCAFALASHGAGMVRCNEPHATEHEQGPRRQDADCGGDAGDPDLHATARTLTGHNN